MAWYKTGTVTVTNNSSTVTGSGTNFVSGAQVGFGFQGPNGLVYEITAINSSTSLTITPVYGGSTASGQSYAIVPTQGLTAALASDVTDLITDYQTVADNAGAGKFGDGSAASPGIRFVNDQDTGFFKDTANEIAVSVGGTKVGEFTSTGIDGTVIGGTTPAAITATTFTSTGIDDNALSTAITIDSSGNLLVSKTSADSSVAGGEIRSQGGIVGARSGNWAGIFNRLTDDGDIVQFRKDDTTVGSIGVLSSRLYAGTGDTGLFFNDQADQIQPWNTSTNAARDAAIDLGDETRRFKDLYLSGGVYLGGTGSANKLDDYEEGTWTPTLEGLSTTGSPTYTTREGWYVKVGDMVTVACAVDLSALGGVAGDLRIKNLPFNASATFTTNANVGPLRLNGVNSEPDGFCVIVLGGQSEAAMRSINANSDTNLLGNNLTNTTGFGFQVSYRTS